MKLIIAQSVSFPQVFEFYMCLEVSQTEIREIGGRCEGLSGTQILTIYRNPSLPFDRFT